MQYQSKKCRKIAIEQVVGDLSSTNFAGKCRFLVL